MMAGVYVTPADGDVTLTDVVITGAPKVTGKAEEMRPGDVTTGG